MRRDRNKEECEKNKQDMLLHFCLPFRGVPERESVPARRTTIECGRPRRNCRAQDTRAEQDEELTRRLLWPIVTIGLLNRCIVRDIRSAGAVSQSGNSKAVV